MAHKDAYNLIVFQLELVHLLKVLMLWCLWILHCLKADVVIYVHL